jgi:hypothetical protein
MITAAKSTTTTTTILDERQQKRCKTVSVLLSKFVGL